MRTTTLTMTLGLAGALACAGCNPASEDTADASVEMHMMDPGGKDAMHAMDAAAMANAAAADAVAAAATATDVPAAAAAAPAMTPPSARVLTPRATSESVRAPTATRIAYSYHYGIEVPTDQAPALMRRHEAACVAAGPAVCQVLGSESERYGRDAVSARLDLRAAPAWLDRFRAGLEGDAERAGGRLAMASTESEDLTRSMTDTEARLRALTTLRDRLQTLLATRSAPLDQLLATERELARVQGELDAARSALTAMNTRVAMSHVSLRYQSEREFAPDSAFTPVARAAKGSVAAFMGTLGAIIYAFASLLPLLLLLSPVAWLAWKHRRRLRIGKGKAAASETVNPDVNRTP